MRRSHGRKPACKICGKKFHPGSLKRHVDSQHLEKNIPLRIQCKLCSEFMLPQDLKNHNHYAHQLVSATDRKKLRECCDLCDKILHPKSMAYHHMSQHTDRALNKMQCNLCKRKFLPDSLKKHMLWMHTEENSLQKMKAQCGYCGAYIKHENLLGHIQSQHNSEASF